MWLLILLVPILLLIVYVLWRHCTLLYKLKNVPGPKKYFLIGGALEIMVTPTELFYLGRKWAKQFQGIYKFLALNVVVCNVYNPEDIETVLSTTRHNGKAYTYSFLKPWLGDGLLLSKGKKWHDRRKILTPTFHFNILEQFCVVFGELSKKITDGVQDNINKPIDVIPLVTEFTLAAICETAMGTHLNDVDHRWKNYKKALSDLTEVIVHRFCHLHLHLEILYRLTSLWLKQTEVVKEVHSLTEKFIANRKSYLKNNEAYLKNTNIRRNKHTPMLDLLIAAQNEGLINDAGIQEEVDTFTFEGHDTSASGLTFCLMLLANNEHIQKEIFTELDEIFGDSTRTASMTDLIKMRYLERCIKESLRLYPPVHFINRVLEKEEILSGHKFPAGSLVNIHIYDLHRDEDLYPSPEKFDPDRFLPENCDKRHPYAYIPFSAGPRNCIGQRFAMLVMKSALSIILRRYKLLPVTTPADIVHYADIILRNTGPVKVVFTPRF